MTEILTAAQMRSIEQAAIESGEVTGLELMERAGQGVVEAIFEEWPELATGDGTRGVAPRPAPSPQGISAKKKRAVVLCGPGNNGGDGFVVARLLHELGWSVEVFLYGDAEKLPPDARVNFERWCDLGAVAPLEDERFDSWPDETDDVCLMVDALFGTGLGRPFLACRHLAMALNTASSMAATQGLCPKVVAVDVPSGLCADAGVWLGDDQPLDFANLANLTVTFHSRKPGHLLADGPESCGNVRVVDIGLSGSQVGGTLSRSALIAQYDERRFGRVICSEVVGEELLSPLKLGPHKYTHGHALVLSGGAGKTGAARLAARGALRVGAGLVTLGVPGAAQQEVAAQVTAIMLQRAGTVEELTKVLQDERLNALCLGPGMGVSRARNLVPTALGTKRATVLDADALTAFADDPEVLFALTHGTQTVLTPHAGEFARLFPDIAAKLRAVPTKGPAYSKVDATREAAARAGCVVLFKGPDTVIAAPDGQCSIHAAVYDRAAPWLATAGSGDVLAGFIVGLLARGFSAKAAAETGAWLHVECARAFGPGLIAEDLPEMLPRVLSALENPGGES
jgi:hydroxyethylthiazole kinase-like uncharacterized protein yjeF